MVKEEVGTRKRRSGQPNLDTMSINGNGNDYSSSVSLLTARSR
jgi:hypothetical protein